MCFTVKDAHYLKLHVDEELVAKVPKVAQSKPRAKPTLTEIEDQSPPLSEPGTPSTCRSYKLLFVLCNQMAPQLQGLKGNSSFQSVLLINVRAYMLYYYSYETIIIKIV